MNLAGNTVRKEHVLLLAALVDGELAAKLNRALINNNTIVALSPANVSTCWRCSAKPRPAVSSELRSVLMKQGESARRRGDSSRRATPRTGADAQSKSCSRSSNRAQCHRRRWRAGPLE
jgi:hypothetical protein